MWSLHTHFAESSRATLSGSLAFSSVPPSPLLYFALWTLATLVPGTRLPSNSGSLLGSAWVAPLPQLWPGNSPKVVVSVSFSQQDLFHWRLMSYRPSFHILYLLSFHCSGWEGAPAPVALSCSEAEVQRVLVLFLFFNLVTVPRRAGVYYFDS